MKSSDDFGICEMMILNQSICLRQILRLFKDRYNILYLEKPFPKLVVPLRSQGTAMKQNKEGKVDHEPIFLLVDENKFLKLSKDGFLKRRKKFTIEDNFELHAHRWRNGYPCMPWA
jgi:hypothetical protein